MSLFPTYLTKDERLLKQDEKISTPREYEIDRKTKRFTGRIVEGLEAIKIWIWLALQTPRYRYFIYSWDYGSEMEDLIGKGYSDEYIKTEMQRMTEDCLLVNEHIKSIHNFSINRTGSYLTISFIVNTLYGTIAFENEKIARAD